MIFLRRALKLCSVLLDTEHHPSHTNLPSSLEKMGYIYLVVSTLRSAFVSSDTTLGLTLTREVVELKLDDESADIVNPA